jgi:hypothetical protein
LFVIERTIVELDTSAVVDEFKRVNPVRVRLVFQAEKALLLRTTKGIDTDARSKTPEMWSVRSRTSGRVCTRGLRFVVREVSGDQHWRGRDGGAQRADGPVAG